MDQRMATVSIRKEGKTPEELASKLAEQNIFVWNGNFYALSISERLGVEPSGGLVRMGLAHYNTLGRGRSLPGRHRPGVSL